LDAGFDGEKFEEFCYSKNSEKGADID